MVDTTEGEPLVDMAGEEDDTGAEDNTTGVNDTDDPKQEPVTLPVTDTPKSQPSIKVKIEKIIEYLFLKRPRYARYVAVITDWPWEIATYVTGTTSDTSSDISNKSTKYLSCIQWFYISLRFLIAFLGLIAQAISCFRRDRLDKNYIQIKAGNDSNQFVECHESSQLFTAIIIPDLIFLFLLIMVSSEIFRTCTMFCENKDLRDLVDTIIKLERQPNNCMLTCPLIPVFYVTYSLGISIMNLFAFDIFDSDVVVHWPSGTNISGSRKTVVIILSLLGFIAIDFLFTQLIVRYALQCRMNIYFLQDIKKKVVDEKYDKQENAIADIEKARKFVNQLNKSSISVGISILITAVQAINSIVSFLDTKNPSFQATALFFRISHWLFLTLFPFFQAAAVNTVSLHLYATGLVMRRKPVIFGGSENEMLRMYASSITIKTKLFGVTINPWFPYVIMVLIALTLTVGSRIRWYENFF